MYVSSVRKHKALAFVLLAGEVLMRDHSPLLGPKH